nr:unnamed protein product [Digitaria exilis]
MWIDPILSTPPFRARLHDKIPPCLPILWGRIAPSATLLPPRNTHKQCRAPTTTGHVLQQQR